MPSITALLHTSNHQLELGRALETLYACDEILIVDHHSQDGTLNIAREYGARKVQFLAGAPPSCYLQFARFEWILCLEPHESLTEALAASLYEWKSALPDLSVNPFQVLLRQETAQGWVDVSRPEPRLVPKTWSRWQGWLPAYEPSAETLEGRLLQFLVPQPGQPESR